jgi:hypothetical protein
MASEIESHVNCPDWQGLCQPAARTPMASSFPATALHLMKVNKESIILPPNLALHL